MGLALILAGCDAAPDVRNPPSKEPLVVASYQALNLKINEAGDAGVASTIPIAVWHKGRPSFVVLDYSTTLMGCDVGWPNWRRVLDAETLQIVEESALPTNAYGVAQPSQRLGKSPTQLGAMAQSEPIPADLRRSSDYVYPAFSRAHEQLWRLYFSHANVTTSAEKDAAALILDRWDDQAEQGFRELYWAIGSDWFAWLQRQREASI